jgi:glycosyltransferase involved in cell wall biosynthesis
MPEIAVLIPCYNEEATIAKVARDFANVLPGAQVYVYDNNSSDSSLQRAAEAGAILRAEPQQGKGHVVRRMFSDITADIYVLVDGDDTYDAAAAPALVKALTEGPYDMVSAVRVEESAAAYRRGHLFGNRAISWAVGQLFGRRSSDVLSGYRAFSNRVVKSFPALARGFEIETELTVHALQLRLPVAEVETPYRERPLGSFSKLKTFSDGARILCTIFYLVKEEKPLAFFGAIGAVMALVSLWLGLPVVEEYMQTGLVPRLPTAVLATSFMLLSFMSCGLGLILDSLTHARLEAKRMHYLRFTAPPRPTR